VGVNVLCSDYIYGTACMVRARASNSQTEPPDWDILAQHPDWNMALDWGTVGNAISKSGYGRMLGQGF
jgi:hypothetical protein